MTPDEHEKLIEEYKFAKTMGLDPWEYLEKKGLIASSATVNLKVTTVLSRLHTLLTYDVTPYVLASLAGQEGNTTAATVHKGTIVWLEKIMEEFQ